MPQLLPTEPISDALLPALDPRLSPTIGLQAGARPTRPPWQSTPALLCLSLLLYALALVFGNFGVPLPIGAFLGIGGAVVLCLTILVALWRALRGVADLVRAA